MSVSSCDVAALRLTLQEILDLVSRKHTFSNASGSHVGYSFFKQYIIALLLQGNLELLESPDSPATQHDLALQVLSAATLSFQHLTVSSGRTGCVGSRDGCSCCLLSA